MPEDKTTMVDMNEVIDSLEKPNILQRINKVRRAVDYIQKEEKKIDGQYRAVSHDAVTALLHEHLVEHGIVVVPTVTKSQTIDTGKKTSRGAPIIRYEATFDVMFFNEDDMKDWVKVSLDAHGEDTGDKAPGKAISYAVKYAKLKLFDLETGEDDEGRIESSPPKLTAENHQHLRDVCNELGLDPEKTLESLAVNVYKFEKITDMNDQFTTDAEKRLRAKAAADASKDNAPA